MELENAADDSLAYARNDHFSIGAVILLIGVPLSTALGNILLRKMRKMNSTTVSCYFNPFLIFSNFIILRCLQKSSFGFMVEIIRMDWLTTFFFVFMGVSTLINQISKFKAHQCDEAAKLSIWQYLDTPY